MELDVPFNGTPATYENSTVSRWCESSEIGERVAWACLGVPPLLFFLFGHGCVVAACLGNAAIRARRVTALIATSSFAAIGAQLFGLLFVLLLSGDAEDKAGRCSLLSTSRHTHKRAIVDSPLYLLLRTVNFFAPLSLALVCSLASVVVLCVKKRSGGVSRRAVSSITAAIVTSNLLLVGIAAFRLGAERVMRARGASTAAAANCHASSGQALTLALLDYAHAGLSFLIFALFLPRMKAVIADMLRRIRDACGARSTSAPRPAPRAATDVLGLQSRAEW